jgi:16S rRNA A1518/A1519 N6-dimethyltransferase RsmA/KsgA/DIM1 with predicted DNA glycosylase/AP lyase activity
MKILKNALNPLLGNVGSNHSPLLKLRAEQLNVDQFVELTNMIDKS